MRGRYYEIHKGKTFYREWKEFDTFFDFLLWKIQMFQYGWKIKNID